MGRVGQIISRFVGFTLGGDEKWRCCGKARFSANCVDNYRRIIELESSVRQREQISRRDALRP
jgi:hypothetical protein